VKTGLLIFWLLLFVTFSRAQTGESSKKEEAQVPARPARAIVPLPSSASLTAGQVAGKKLFVQRCAVCHLPMLPSYTAFGPLLDGNVIASRGDTAVREQIMRGSARMPGWQYTLSPAEIEQMIGYLKTLDFTKKE
jgi:mono/diheme cytochrome c family protein